MANIDSMGHKDNVGNALMPYIKKAMVLHEWSCMQDTLHELVSDFGLLEGKCLIDPSTWCSWLMEAEHMSIIFY